MKTNHIKLIALLGIFCTLAFIGCKKDDVLLADTKEIVLSPEVKQVTFNLTVDKEGIWQINRHQIFPPRENELFKDWYKVNPYSGGGVTSIAVTVSLIEDAIPTEDKEGLIQVKKGDKEVLIPVKFKK